MRLLSATRWSTSSERRVGNSTCDRFLRASSRVAGAEAQRAAAGGGAERFVHRGAQCRPARHWMRCDASSIGGQFLRIVAVDRDAHDARAIGRRLRAVNRDAVDLAQAVEQSRDQVACGARESLRSFRREKLDGGGEAGQADQVVIAGLVFVAAARRAGGLRRSACRCRRSAAASVRARRPGRMYSTPVPSGPKQPFVPRRGEQIDVELPHVERHVAQRLGRIDQEQRVVLADDSADFLDRLNRAGDIRGVDHRDQPRVRPEGRAHVVGRDEALAVARHVASLRRRPLRAVPAAAAAPSCDRRRWSPRGRPAARRREWPGSARRCR